MEHMFQTFSSTSSVPPESKLQTYLNSMPNPIEDGNFFGDTSSLSTTEPNSLSVDLGKSLNSEVGQFGNSAIGRMTHSLSSPSFSQYSVQHPQLVSTPFGHFNVAADVGNRMSRCSPQQSPLLNKRTCSPGPKDFSAPSPSHEQYLQSSTLFQESVGGTTYFYSQEETPPEISPLIMPDINVYPGNPSHIEHMRPKANAPSFFLPDELRMDIIHRQHLTLAEANPEQHPDLPNEVDNYHKLCPLEPPIGDTPAKSSTFGYVTTVYKAANIKTGVYYCLRRIHGFRVSNTKCISIIETWKKLQHSNLVHLREVFTTKAFGDNSMVFVHDYHPGADTLMNLYFNQTSVTPAVNGFLPNFCSDVDGLSTKSGLNNLRQHAGLLPESLIWGYIVQLSSVLRSIHAAGLACRAFDPSKILVTGKSRLRLNCCGIFDVLTYDPNQHNTKQVAAHFQQEDLMAFGKIVLALACNTLNAVKRSNMTGSLELVSRNYSADLRNLILYLLHNQTRPHSINDIMPMIGARFYTQLDAAQMRSDVIENELSKEVENGRLFRLLVKLGTITERAELNMDHSWAETGDRYLLKLFRDYLFHQVTEDGRPWVDTAHVIQCLNKLDAGASEKICLMARDEQNVLVVSYAELKACFESSFSEIVTSALGPKPHS
ncbi:LOW QUALITY PROTEIN: PAN2-PAN3 deadenylation complex subunit pan3-like [Uloborus diversus]|uniref:LOW QUALITY PROTEIN: PAN2-PAN3 deadenylation complex subunit pan3-like n=1 Tax=Uloborus diversus TaxID=327109 RepID=UPI0024090158|nr:LOW QUALITY PROTEIN: PAN2-PAN3 deadenylation complex subunit pan3-like [Uloborus diversus]